MIAKQIQFFGKDLEIWTAEDQKPAIGGGRGRRRRRRRRQEERNGGGEEEVDPGCPPDYDD